MQKTIYQTDSEGLKKILSEAVGKYETYAPVEKFGRFFYEKVGSVKEFELVSPIEKTLSVKPLFLPQTSDIIRFKENREGITIQEPITSPIPKKRLILGVKMCDAHGMKILENISRWSCNNGECKGGSCNSNASQNDVIQNRDSHDRASIAVVSEDDDFLKRRENSILFVSACAKAESKCFCTSLDFDLESNDAYDVLHVNYSDDIVYLKAMSAKGEEFLSGFSGSMSKVSDNASDRASDEANDNIKDFFDKFRQTFQKKIDYNQFHEKLKSGIDNLNFDECSKVCISCNACAFICPTCYCFSVTDEKVKETGVRYKFYDSCACDNFTRMAGGHDPRPEKTHRWRQRALHKFVYFKERFGTNLCVGCGRCVSFCPVNVDIFDVIVNAVKSPKE
ncbi:MAG: 4Fe-4S dicluster domain-containing protein [Candidatus Riflebacteria bacterium]|nr:4Fe-4S dicluster domain-containing protein [Candidatus Riflebacteria bacterium]